MHVYFHLQNRAVVYMRDLLPVILNRIRLCGRLWIIFLCVGVSHKEARELVEWL